MRTALVVGLPIAPAVRLRRAVQRSQVTVPPGWQLEVLRSRHRASVSIDLKVLTQWLEHDFAGAHVMCFKPPEAREQDRIRSFVLPYFRFRWLQNSLLSSLPANIGDFVTRLSDVLLEEERWASAVRPSDERSPLLLPESSFAAASIVRTAWTVAASASSQEEIEKAARAVEEFQRWHWRRYGAGRRAWLDIGGRVFDDTGARHGRAPFPRSWKYSYQVSDGFHYDVTSGDGREFHLLDRYGQRHRVLTAGHINVDPHGYVRRA